MHPRLVALAHSVLHCCMSCSRWGSSSLQGVRQTNFKRIRRRVKENLFLAKPAFLPHLTEIQRQVNEIQSISFSWAKDSHVYTLQEYADIQVATREQKAKPALEQLAENITKVRASAASRHSCPPPCLPDDRQSHEFRKHNPLIATCLIPRRALDNSMHANLCCRNSLQAAASPGCQLRPL